MFPAVHAVLVEVPVVGSPFLSKCYSSLFSFVSLIQVLFQDGAISLQYLDHPLPLQGNLLGKGESSKEHLSNKFLIGICILFLGKEKERESIKFLSFCISVSCERNSLNRIRKCCKIFGNSQLCTTLQGTFLKMRLSFLLLSPGQSCLF